MGNFKIFHLIFFNLISVVFVAVINKPGKYLPARCHNCRERENENFCLFTSIKMK